MDANRVLTYQPTLNDIENALDDAAEDVMRHVVDTKRRIRQMFTTQVMRFIGTTLVALAGILVAIIVESKAPAFWAGEADHAIVYYSVEPAVDGTWRLECLDKKSPPDGCTSALRTRSQIVHFKIHSDKADAGQVAWEAGPDAYPNDVIASSAPLARWIHYEVLRGLTLGSFEGKPTLDVRFEPTERFADILELYSSSGSVTDSQGRTPFPLSVIAHTLGGVFGGETQLASMAESSLREAGIFKDSGLWRTVDRTYLYACYASWKGGYRLAALRNTSSWAATICDDDAASGGLSATFILAMVYLGASSVLAFLTTVGALWVAMKALRAWMLGEARIMQRSSLFAYYHRHAASEARTMGKPVCEIIAMRTPLVVMLECAIANADGDVDNVLTPKEGLQASLLQGAYIVSLAIPIHLFHIFTSRPIQSLAFASPWSFPAFWLMGHYGLHWAFCVLHYTGMFVRWGKVARRFIDAYKFVTNLSIGLAVFLLIMQTLWLCSTVSYNQSYVIKVTSITGSFSGFAIICLQTASKFGKSSDELLSQVDSEMGLAMREVQNTSTAVQAEARAAMREVQMQAKQAQEAVGQAVRQAKAVEEKARDMAKSIDISGKQLARGFLYALLVLVLTATWILTGHYLWAARGVSLTSLAMPSFVLAIKKHADKSVQKITSQMPQTLTLGADVRGRFKDMPLQQVMDDALLERDRAGSKATRRVHPMTSETTVEDFSMKDR